MKSTLATACVLVLAGLVSACDPGAATDNEPIMWSSLTLDSSGKTIMKRDVISRAELGRRRQAREMMRTGALKPEGAAAYLQASGDQLARAGVGYLPLPRYDWSVSHWLWRWDQQEVVEFMPSTIVGAGDLYFWAYSDGSNIGHSSFGFEAGVHSGSYCSNNTGLTGCSGATWQFPAWATHLPPPFEMRDHHYLQLNN